jgi:long-subunit acyl-CoA synthetase (AMP-forming)
MLNAHAKKKGLMGFEQAKNIFITVETFQEKAVVSTSLKLQRHEAKKVFADQINAMYQEGMLGGRPE